MLLGEPGKLKSAAPRVGVARATQTRIATVASRLACTAPSKWVTYERDCPNPVTGLFSFMVRYTIWTKHILNGEAPALLVLIFVLSLIGIPSFGLSFPQFQWFTRGRDDRFPVLLWSDLGQDTNSLSSFLAYYLAPPSYYSSTRGLVRPIGQLSKNGSI